MSYIETKYISERRTNFVHSSYLLYWDPSWRVYTNTQLESSTGRSEVKTIYRDPDWKKKIAKRLDASQPYILWKITERLPPYIYAEARLKSADYWTKSKGYSGGFPVGIKLPTLEPFHDATIKDWALKRFKRGLRDHDKSTNIMVPLAEIREVVSLWESIVDGITTLAYLLLQLVRSFSVHGVSTVLKDYKLFMKAVSELWLSWSFGIKPMFDDVENALAAYERAIEDTFSSTEFRVSGSASKEWKSTVRTAGTETFLYNAWRQDTIEWNYRLKYKYVGGFHTSLLSQTRGFRERLGLLSEGLFSTAWELIPFSWLVDYFITVGDFLDDLTIEPSNRTTDFLTCTTTYTGKATVIPSAKPMSNCIVTNQVIRDGHYGFIHIERELIPNLPRRILRFKLGREIYSNFENKLGNLFALLGLIRFGRT